MAKRNQRGRSLLALLVALLLAVSLGACDFVSKDEKSVRETVDNTFAVFQDPEGNDISAFVDSKIVTQLSTNGLDVTQFLTSAFAHLTYEVKDVKVDGDTAEVQLTVSNVNLDDAMTAALKEFSDWYETEAALTVYRDSGEQGLYRKLFEMLYAKIDEMADSPASNDVTLHLKRNGDAWEASDDENQNAEFYSALYGGATFSFEQDDVDVSEDAEEAATAGENAGGEATTDSEKAADAEKSADSGKGDAGSKATSDSSKSDTDSKASDSDKGEKTTAASNAATPDGQ